MEITAGLSMQKALEAPKFYQMQQKMTEPEIIAIIALNIRYFCDALNVKENMNMIQILETSYEFFKTYSYDSLKDLMLCLKKARNGEYGEIYNRIDQQVVMIFWQKYQEEKSVYLENKHLDTKARESTKPLLTLAKAPETIKQQLDEQLDKFMKHTASGYIARLDQRKADGDTYQQYLTNLEHWMKCATDEEIEELRKEAEAKGAREVVEVLDSRPADR